MDRRTALVLMGYFELSEDQRSEFMGRASTYERGSYATKERVRTDVRRYIAIDTGPLTSSCPCCGR